MAEPLVLIRRIRFSCSQWAEIACRAEACGLTPSAYVRATALGAVPRTRRQAKEQDLVYHLARVGNNLNQLTKRHNSGDLVPRREVLATLDRVNAAIRGL
jgi:hypothetical protein